MTFMMQTQRAILQTVIYSDLFDFPLKPEELWFFLKSNKRLSRKFFLSTLYNLESISEHDGFYVLKNRKSIVKQRQHREAISQKKLLLAERMVKFLSFIPSILLIGISGSLAMNNAKEEDDIDLFLIVKRNTLWTTRLLALLILELFHIRRRKQTTRTQNTVCLNMIIDENALAFSKDKQDIYIAHEIAQLKPLFDRNNAYHRLLAENSWIKNFMPNIPIVIARNESSSDAAILSNKQIASSVTPRNDKASLLEYIAKQIQLYNINKSKTTETITNTLLAFHPNDNRQRTLARYNKKLKNFLL